MAHCDFSKFSYGFALTNEMLGRLPALGAAPLFPSLISEGRLGYDVQISAAPIPLFLQFMIPDVLPRTSQKMPKDFPLPYFRMHLRTNKGAQHRPLLDLEKPGNVVSYVTPKFYRVLDLDRHFAARSIEAHSAFIKPSEIGRLDQENHHVAYSAADRRIAVCSTPTVIDGRFDSEAFYERVMTAIEQADKCGALEFFSGIAAEIEKETRAIETEGKTRPSLQLPSFGTSSSIQIGSEGAPDRPPELERREASLLGEVAAAARKAAYLSQIRLGCTLIITGRKD